MSEKKNAYLQLALMLPKESQDRIFKNFYEQIIEETEKRGLVWVKNK